MVAKYGLLIGITYPNTSAALPGCDNDILEIYRFLNTRGYKEFNVLCDTNVFEDETINVSKPTASEIVRAFFNLIEWAKKNPDGQIFFHYSGHGTQVADNSWVFNESNKIWSKEEADGKDECIVTQDLKLITDDQLHWLFSKLPSTITLFSLMDSCHSGSVFDLQYYLKEPNKSVQLSNQPALNAEIIMISGCKDEQYGQSYVFGNKWYGVMSYAFLYLMNYMNNYKVENMEIGDVWKFMTLICTKFPQLPQASCSKNDFSSINLKCTKTEFSLEKKQTTPPTITRQYPKKSVKKTWKMNFI